MSASVMLVARPLLAQTRDSRGRPECVSHAPQPPPRPPAKPRHAANRTGPVAPLRGCVRPALHHPGKRTADTPMTRICSRLIPLPATHRQPATRRACPSANSAANCRTDRYFHIVCCAPVLRARKNFHFYKSHPHSVKPHFALRAVARKTPRARSATDNMKEQRDA